LPPSNKRILCIEDDDDTCSLVSRILEGEGYEVISAGTLAEGSEVLQGDGISLIILNVWLPDGNGIDFIRKVRAKDSLTPILVHSAAAYKKDIEEAIQVGANDYLVKPNGWAKLAETVAALLRQSRSAG
jgi:two-component system, OmpR family, KDP operon response regulator KdpE